MFDGDRVAVWKDEKCRRWMVIAPSPSPLLCNSMNVLNATEMYTLNGLSGNFYVYFTTREDRCF